jgi:hypothetical protein
MMATIHNPALQEEPRSQKTSIVPPRPEQSMLRWLESQGRLIGAESPEHRYYGEVEAEEDLEDLTESPLTSSWEEEEDRFDLEE